MNYLEILKHSYAVQQANLPGTTENRLVYLSDHIFGFTTYDSDMDELFATKAVEVCAAINDGKTISYVQDAENHKWYLLMCNMPFFQGRLDWGTSIRGAWWDTMPRKGKEMELESCGIWLGDKQCVTLKFPDVTAWREFIAAVIDFAAGR